MSYLEFIRVTIRIEYNRIEMLYYLIPKGNCKNLKIRHGFNGFEIIHGFGVIKDFSKDY